MDSLTILSRGEHPISRKHMPTHVLKVLYRLKSKGYMGLLVGGALRDLYRDREPRDFDVATDAPLEEIRSLFRNSKTIGKRFPIVHAYFGNEVVEISSLKGEEGMSGYDLVYEDALRRDFTVNAVFYNIDGFKVVDPLGAIPHVVDGQVVCIGDPEEKFSEDAVRILRALKLVAKQGFKMGPELIESITHHAEGVREIGPGRKYEEITRILLDRHGLTLLALCKHYHILEHLWPQGDELLEINGLAYFDQLRESMPISFSRGSFAKHSHTHLWLRMFLDSPFYRPSTDHEVHKHRFEAFLEPLAMPFRAPIVDALVSIGHMELEPDLEPRFRFSKEVQKLLQHYLDRPETHVDERFYDYIYQSERKIKEKTKQPQGGKRRRRRRGGKRRRGGGKHSGNKS